MDWKLGGLIFAVAAAVSPASAQELPDFLGIQLGAPFTMSECRISSYVYDVNQPVVPCWKVDVLTQERGPLPEGNFEIEFDPGFDNMPRSVKWAKVIVVDGRMVGVNLSTRGYAYQDDVSAALVAKFGEPSAAHTTTTQNRMGATFERKSAIWQLSPVTVSFLGIGSSLDSGVVTVLLPEGEAFNKSKIEAFRKSRQGAF